MIDVLLLAACSLAEADDVAAVMLTTGQASVLSEGVEAPAATGLALDRKDVLKTGPEGAIIVHLSNDHLVRIDSDLELAVADIVMLSAPQATVPPGQQLADLLYPEEVSALGDSVVRAERVAGWHSRLTATEGISGLQRESAPGADESSPSPVVYDNEDKSEAPSKTKPRPSGARGGRPAPPPAETSPAAGAPQAPPKPDKAPVQPLDPAKIPDWFQANGPLRQCIVDWAGTLGVPLDSVQIRLTIVDGEISRLSNSRGLRLPLCAREALEGQAVHGPPATRTEFRVPLSE